MKKYFCYLLLFVLTPGFNATALADMQLSQLSKEEAARIVRDKKLGKLLDFRAEKRNGQQDYRAKVLNNKGRVKIYNVDGETGEVRRR